MKKGNIWVVLAVVYVFVIAAVVVFRMKKQSPTPSTTTSNTSPVTSTSTTPTPESQPLYVEFQSTKSTANTKEVALQLLDASTFESAGYTLEIEYDPAVIKVVDIIQGDVWSKSTVLQKDLSSSPNKITYSLGRAMESEVTGKKNLATLKVQVVNTEVMSTQISLSQTSRSAADGEAKTIIAEPITLTLK